ncbi:MAG: hypothetical protein F6K24_48980 [Okeania sp. SIO2D1]|uniref:hypothetical protein n=1 Tax=Okeania sp. SIO1I7 TaxID=2607772 RepID=UPI0013BE09E5|nr:hypothetical protein [Okeania sp. SIO1I7]NES72577.1 hypothetical protein [Okeania sp. SIO2D1]NET25530.1 hypothetical protein [Okeania sp. SIO1I7]
MGIEPIQFAADSSGRQITDYGVRLKGDLAKTQLRELLTYNYSTGHNISPSYI